MAITDVREAIAWQASHADKADAPITGRIVRAELAILDTRTELARRMNAWPGLSLEDAMPLRVAGALHWLHLSGAEARLAPVYAGEVADQAVVDEIVAAVAIHWDAKLVPWLDHPPQTNEAGRSASFMGGLLWLSQVLGPRFELNEIGASAGVNTMIERYFYDLGGTQVGPADSPMRIVPESAGFTVKHQLTDYDGDGLSELVLTAEVQGHEHFAVEHHILKGSGGKVRPYPGLVDVDIEALQDFDGDGRLDVVSIDRHYPAENCLDMEPIPVGAPPVLYHATKDGTFSATDEVAREFLREQCPSKPRTLVAVDPDDPGALSDLVGNLDQCRLEVLRAARNAAAVPLRSVAETAPDYAALYFSGSPEAGRNGGAR